MTNLQNTIARLVDLAVDWSLPVPGAVLTESDRLGLEWNGKWGFRKIRSALRRQTGKRI